MDERDYVPDEEARMAETRPVRQSGAVTAVAVVNFVLGGLQILIGLLIMIVGPAIVGMAASAVDTSKMTPEQARQFKQATTTGGGIVALGAAVFGGCILIFGVPMIIAGIGVIKRRQWGRILSIVLASLAIVGAIVWLLTFNIIGLLINGGYAVVVFVILLNKQYAAEFR